MIALVAARIVADGLIARFILGLRGGRFWRAFAAIIAADGVNLLLASPLIYWMASRSAGSAVHRTIATLAAAAVVLVVMLLVWEGAILLAAHPRAHSGAPLLSRGRVAAAATALLIAGLLGIVGLAVVQERADFPAGVTTWQVRVAHLPAEFDGLRIACVGDLHVHRDHDRDALRRRLRALGGGRGLRPYARTADLILFVGDYATGAPRYEADAAAVMAEQRAPLGVFAVLGNHDRWVGQENSLRALREAGVRVLLNQHVKLTRGGASIYLAGVNDPYTWGDDLGAACAGIPKGACILLMAHSPDIIPKARRRGIALVLAGHTHGGQVNLPLVGPPVVLSHLGRKYAHGVFRQGKTMMFVTRGAGEIFPPIRFNCPREIAVLTLRRG